jgi:hypothetical protein
VKAPEHERMELLSVAIERATFALNAPIDRIEVTSTHVSCWAGPKKVTLSYAYAQGGELDPATGRFMPTPGSGTWQVSVITDPAARRPEIIGQALAKLLKRQGW